MTDTIAELRELLAAERSALRAMKESGAPNDALLDAWLKASGRLNSASIAALPALLDRVEAGEREAFDAGYAACWAEMFVRSGEKPAFALTDEMFDRGWRIHLENKTTEAALQQKAGTP